jgi:hypothetical protein
MDNQTDKNVLAWINSLIRLKIQTAFAEIIQFAGMNKVVCRNIMGKEGFIFKAFMSPSFIV